MDLNNLFGAFIVSRSLRLYASSCSYLIESLFYTAPCSSSIESSSMVLTVSSTPLSTPRIFSALIFGSGIFSDLVFGSGI